MPICETPDFTFPMLADIYYPIVEQGSYGAIKKQWVLDRTVACSVSGISAKLREEVKPNVNITQDKSLQARVKTDIRLSETGTNFAITNVILTNIRDASGNSIYNETRGVRSGKSTIYEISALEPWAGAFGSVEYFKLILRRSENQASDV